METRRQNVLVIKILRLYSLLASRFLESDTKCLLLKRQNARRDTRRFSVF